MKKVLPSCNKFFVYCKTEVAQIKTNTEINKMSDEEDDYMSDKFLSTLTDIRPGLVDDRAEKRKIEKEAKQAKSNKRQRELASVDPSVHNERLQESLSRQLDETNKGYQMLAKMGFKPGTSLGSNASSSNAIKEPIGIKLKSDRGGLGREAALQELSAKRAELQRQHFLRKAGVEDATQISSEAYRMRFTQKNVERKVLADLRSCQRSCETLDLQAHIIAPELEFFWPKREDEPLSEDEEEDQDKDDETDDDSDEDKDRDDDNDDRDEDSEKIVEIKERKDSPKPKQKGTAEEDEDGYTNAEKLELLTLYLRTAYQFCYFCGTRYDNEQDLIDNCPGTTRDEH